MGHFPRTVQEQPGASIRCHPEDTTRRGGQRGSGPQLIPGGPGSTPEAGTADAGDSQSPDVDVVLGACPHRTPTSPGHCQGRGAVSTGKALDASATRRRQRKRWLVTVTPGTDRNPGRNQRTAVRTATTEDDDAEGSTAGGGGRWCRRFWKLATPTDLPVASYYRSKKDVPTACTPTVTAAWNTTTPPCGPPNHPAPEAALEGGLSLAGGCQNSHLPLKTLLACEPASAAPPDGQGAEDGEHGDTCLTAAASAAESLTPTGKTAKGVQGLTCPDPAGARDTRLSGGPGHGTADATRVRGRKSAVPPGGSGRPRAVSRHHPAPGTSSLPPRQERQRPTPRTAEKRSQSKGVPVRPTPGQRPEAAAGTRGRGLGTEKEEEFC